MSFKDEIFQLSSEIIEQILLKSEALYKDRFYKNKIKRLNIIDEVASYSPEKRLIELNYILHSTNSRSRSLFYINKNHNYSNIRITFLYSPDLEASGSSDFSNQSIMINLFQISSLMELQSTLIHELTHLKDWEYSTVLMRNYYEDGLEYFTHPLEIKPWLMEIWYYQSINKSSFEDTILELLGMYCDENQISEISDFYRFKIENDEFYRNTFYCLLENQNCA
jgi:hypothetical protein